MPTIGIEMDSYIVDEAVGSISVAIIGDRPVPSGWVELDLINADLAGKISFSSLFYIRMCIH